MSELTLLAGERQSSESSPAVSGCNDWLRMGPGRTLPKLLARWSKTGQDSPPTDSLGTLKHWSDDYGWQKRAEEYDARIDAAKTEAANRIMRSGLALTHRRVSKLKRLAVFLEKQLYEVGEDKDGNPVYHNVWVPDVKSIGSGPMAERVDIERFNGPIFEQYRGTLDDLAKETGGRVQKQEVTGKDGKEFVLRVVYDSGRPDGEAQPALPKAS